MFYELVLKIFEFVSLIISKCMDYTSGRDMSY
jgi:hypothetical protein